MMKKPFIQWVKLLALATGLSAVASAEAGCYRDSPELLRYKAREYQRIIDSAAAIYRVDPNLISAVITAESCFQPRALSPKGARGLMQLMPATGRRFGVSDRSNPTQNIHAGTRYLRWLLDRYNGSVYHAVAAYNSGEGRVDRYGLNVPFEETQTYMKRVVSTYKRLHASPAPNAAQQAALMRRQALLMRQAALRQQQAALRQQAYDRQQAALNRVVALRQAAFRQPTVSLRQAALLDAAQQEVTIQRVVEAEVAQADLSVARGIIEADDNPVVIEQRDAGSGQGKKSTRERRLTSRASERRLVSKVVEKRLLPSCKSSSRQLRKATVHSDSKGERSYYYTVRRNDTIEKITRLTGVSVAMIKGYNDMTRSLIRPGQKLKVSECRLKK